MTSANKRQKTARKPLILNFFEHAGPAQMFPGVSIFIKKQHELHSLTTSRFLLTQKMNHQHTSQEHIGSSWLKLLNVGRSMPYLSVIR